MGKYRMVLSAFVMAVMVSLALGGCATAPSPAMPPVAEKKADWRDQYNLVGDFSEGRAWVRKGNEEFHVLPDGTPAYPERYDMVGSFSEGRAGVVKDGKWFHILADGAPVYHERYDEIDSFFEGRAWVRKGNEEFHIDFNGKRIKE